MISEYISKDKDGILKENYNAFYNSDYDKLIISVHVQKVEKMYDYFVLQSICLIDTITGQKPKLKVLKCKYTFGSKAFSYSCKVTLRKIKISNLLGLFNYVVFSEMKRRHISLLSLLNIAKTQNAFSFSISNTAVFLKLDEFYFKWNYPIVFTFVKNLLLISSDFNYKYIFNI